MKRLLIAGSIGGVALLAQSANAALTATAGNLSLNPGGSGYVDIVLHVTGTAPVASSYTVKVGLPVGGKIYFPWNSGAGDLDSAYPLQAPSNPLFPTFNQLTTIDSGQFLLGISALNAGDVTLFDGAGLARVPVVADPTATAGNSALSVTVANFVPNVGSPFSADTLQAGTITVAVPEPASLGLIGLAGLLLGRRRVA